MSGATELQRSLRRLKIGSAMLCVLATLVGVGVVSALYLAGPEAPTLGAEGGPLAEALQWPWDDFPAVTETERRTLERDFNFSRPLLLRQQRLWLSNPRRSSLGSLSSDAQDALASVQRIHDTPEASQRGELTDRAIQDALAALSADVAGSRRWLGLYNRGVLNQMQGDARSALQSLESALERLPRDVRLAVGSSPAARSIDPETTAAAVYTFHGLALAQARMAAEDSGAQGARLRNQSLDHIRAALLHAIAYYADAKPQPLGGAHHALGAYPIGSAGLTSTDLQSDLLAAYLWSPQYHLCSEQPVRSPCDESELAARKRSKQDDCLYRDLILCNSATRPQPPFGDPFMRTFENYYERGDFEQESLLLALSNSLDYSVYNSAPNGRLLYHLGAVLALSGEFDDAAAYLERALDYLPDPEEYAHARPLAVIARALSREQTDGRSGRASRKSSVRSLFESMHPETVPPFGPADDNPSLAETVDRWLFLKVWEEWLREGDFDRFARESGRLLERDEIPMDFFRSWRNDVEVEFVERALQRADELSRDGELQQAALVRRYVSSSGHFSPALADAASSIPIRLWRYAKPWVVGLTAVLVAAVVLVGTVFFGGLKRTYRETFFSSHRIERMGDIRQAYPTNNHDSPTRT